MPEEKETQTPSTKTKRGKVEDAKASFAERQVAEPQKKSRFGWLFTLFLVVVIGASLWLVFSISDSFDDSVSFAQIFASADLSFALCALAALVGAILCETLKFTLTAWTLGEKIGFSTSLKTALLGKYYDNVTPFASGGQPMQIYYLHKRGYGAGTATAMVFIKTTLTMFCWLGLCLVLMLAFPSTLDVYVADETLRGTYLIAGWIGWGLSALFPTALVVMALLPKVTGAILKFFVNVGAKLRLVRNKEKVNSSAERAANDFRNAFVILIHKPLKFLLLTLTCIAEPFLTMALPYFVFASLAVGKFVPSTEMMFQLMTMEAFAQMSVSFIPTPGTGGALEISIAKMFEGVLGAALAWSVVTWRFLSFYVYILIGIGITVFDLVRRIVISSKQKKSQK